MRDTILFSFIIALALLIIGLIRPVIFFLFFRREMNRKDILKIFGIATIIFFILSGIVLNINNIIIEDDAIEDDIKETGTLSELHYEMVKGKIAKIEDLEKESYLSYSPEEWNLLSTSKILECEALIFAEIEEINEDTIHITANKIIRDLTFQDPDIDIIFLSIYYHKDKIRSFRYLARIVWAPQGDPIRINSDIILKKDRSSYETKINISRDLTEYLEIQKIYRDALLTPPVENIGLTLNVTINNNILKISGNANLPDDAFIFYEADHEFRRYLDEGVGFIWGLTKVKNGKYELLTDISNWSSGDIKVRVVFEVFLWSFEFGEKQPQEVIDLYGKYGEKITDPSAFDTGHNRRIEQTSIIRKPY